jgi:hypothetical protein
MSPPPRPQSRQRLHNPGKVPWEAALTPGLTFAPWEPNTRLTAQSTLLGCDEQESGTRIGT